MAADGKANFSMGIDKTKKVFTAFAEGFFSMDQGVAFCQDFMKAANECSRDGNYHLIVDVKGVKPSTPEVAKALGDALSLYASDDFKFKGRYMTKLTSAITQSQVARLAKNIPGFDDKITFVDTKEDALKLISK